MHMLCEPANFITERECVSPHLCQETCTKTTHSSPFTALKNWNQPKSLYTAEIINKLWENTVCSENERTRAIEWMNLGTIVSISKCKSEKYFDSALMH